MILTFDGQKIDEMRVLPRIVLETPIGKKVRVSVWRDGKTIEIPVKIGKFDQPKVAAAEKPTPRQEPVGKTILGMDLASLTPLLRERFELDPGAKGVAVLGVDPEGKAAEKGIQAGDLILEVDRRRFPARPTSRPA